MNLSKAHRTLQKSHSLVIEQWLETKALSSILEQLQMKKREYKEQVAEPVFTYLLGMLKAETPKSDCPAMRILVETFLDFGLEVEDVFLNCSSFKNIINSTLYSDKGVQKEEIANVMQIMDSNLYEVLKIYSKEKEIKARRSSFHSKLIQEHVAMSITDPNGFITYATNAFAELAGYTPSELVGNTHKIIRHEEMSSDLFASMWQTLQKGQIWRGEIKNRKKCGGEFIAKTEIIPYFDCDGNLLEYIAVRHDITDKVLSAVDSLTSLHNRRYLEETLPALLQKYKQSALMLLDIDYFKKINDTYGHLFGDYVLKEFSKTLIKMTRTQDIVVRWGGEEFIVALPDTSLDAATEIAQRVRKSIEEMLLRSKESGALVRIQCCIGVSSYKANETLDQLIQRVDANLYSAKKSGRNQVVAK